jgi:hypothetical protein
MSERRGLFDLDSGSTALISPDGLYRYTLHRGACHGSGLLNFIMLNPSKADHEINDPTIRRCLGYARSWGYADLVVTNLFAFRSPNPIDLMRVVDPVGPDNDRHILEWAAKASTVVCGWGAHGKFKGRGAAVRKLLADAGIKPQALKLTNDGEPCHPLYLRGDLLTFELDASRVT